jgi:hypothetical protein
MIRHPKIIVLAELLPNGFELSGRGLHLRYVFYPPTSYNFAMKTHSIPGPFQRIVMWSRELENLVQFK